MQRRKNNVGIPGFRDQPFRINKYVSRNVSQNPGTSLFARRTSARVRKFYREQQILLPLSGIRISPADSRSPAKRDHSRPTKRPNIQLSKNEVQAVYPWGLGWSGCSYPDQIRAASSLIPEWHEG